MNNLAVRSITGAGFVVVMLGSVLLGQFVFSLLFLLVAVLGLNEFYALYRDERGNPGRMPAMATGLILYLSLALHAGGYVDWRIFLLNIPVTFLLFIVELWRKQSQPFLSISLSLSGIIYISLPLGLSLYLFNPDVPSGFGHFGVMLGFLLILWLNDTGAYLIGSWIGKHKLFERISPKKTWEGSMGGAFMALLTSWGMALLVKGIPLWQWISIGLIIVIFGTLGDLVESMLKRSLGIKDSGTILPGHGGILDRFDALLLAVPFVFVFLAIFS